jgi:hypothetical protein
MKFELPEYFKTLAILVNIAVGFLGLCYILLYIYIICVNNGTGENPRNMALLISSVAAILNLFAICYFYVKQQKYNILERDASSKRYWLRNFVTDKDSINEIEDFFKESIGILENSNAKPENQEEIIKKISVLNKKGINLICSFPILEVINHSLKENIKASIEEFIDKFTSQIEKDEKDIMVIRNDIDSYKIRIYKALYEYESNIHNY